MFNRNKRKLEKAKEVALIFQIWASTSPIMNYYHHYRAYDPEVLTSYFVENILPKLKVK